MMHNNDFLTLIEEYRPYVKEVDVHHINKKLLNKENFSIIDVREDYEWQQGYIPNAIHLKLGTIEKYIENTIPDKTQPIVLYCAGGLRSILAAYNLQKIGYKNVLSMAGGIREWITSNYQLTI